jgi:hypothetical protein
MGCGAIDDDGDDDDNNNNNNNKLKTKLCSLSLQANYTDRASAACQRT